MFIKDLFNRLSLNLHHLNQIVEKEIKKQIIIPQYHEVVIQ